MFALAYNIRKWRAYANGQQPGRAVSSFFDHDKFEVMKMLSSLGSCTL